MDEGPIPFDERGETAIEKRESRITDERLSRKILGDRWGPSEKESSMVIGRLRGEVRILKTEKALNDVLNDLDGMIAEAEDGDFSLDDLRDLRADLHGAMSRLREP